MAGFLGLRGTGDWATDQRPKNWREMILFLYPNGDAPLTALMSKLASEGVNDPEFNWWTKSLASQGGAITNIYTDVTLSSAYTSGGSAGDVVYVNVAEAVADEFRAGHQVLLRDSSHYDVDVNAKVTAVVKNGASSYIACKLLEADDNGASTDLSDADRILIVGNVNPEGGAMPSAISYDPTKWYNYTQIWRTPLEITRTARKTKLRTGDAYQELKREALELHSIEIEKSLIWGIRTENTGANGKPERTTMGLIPAIRAGAPANVNDYTLNTTYSGDTWLTSGEVWLDTMLEQIFRYGRTEKLALCGSGAILGINRLIKNGGNFDFTPKTTSYGIRVMEWVTPFGTINMMRHPLFSYEETNRNSMVILEPQNLKWRFIDDTKFYKAGEKTVDSGQERIDGTKEEYLTEAGLEYHHPTAFGYLNGVGEDNDL